MYPTYFLPPPWAASIFFRRTDVPPKKKPGRPKSQWGSGAADRPGFGRICRSREKKRGVSFALFLVIFTGSRRNRSLELEICVTVRNHYAKGPKPGCKFVTLSRPTDRLFSSPPSARLPLGIRAARVGPRNYDGIGSNITLTSKPCCGSAHSGFPLSHESRPAQADAARLLCCR